MTEEVNKELIEFAKKIAINYVETFKEVPSKTRSWVCGAVCGGGCGAGCGGGCVAGCQADTPWIPVADVGAATASGTGAGGVATGVAEKY